MTEPKVYELTSNGFAYTPGMLRYAQNMYRNGDDSAKSLAVRIFTEGYADLDTDTARGLVSDTIPYEVTTDTVIVTEVTDAD
mgnify:CR=1 FL=1